MTIEVKDTFTIKSKRKEHPNAGKYPGRPSMEFGTALRHFLSDVGSANLDAFERGEFVFDEEITSEFFDSLLPGDVVGLGILKGFNEYGMNEHCSPTAYKFKILSVDKDKDIIQARNVTFEHPKVKEYVGTEVELTFEEISCAFGMGFGEILERDGKPYGVSEEIELKVKVYGKKEEETIASTPVLPVLTENATAANAPANVTEQSTNPVVSPGKPKAKIKKKKKLIKGNLDLKD